MTKETPIDVRAALAVAAGKPLEISTMQLDGGHHPVTTRGESVRGVVTF